MENVHLNANRIEQLVDQLYALNRKLVGLEGQLMRLAIDRKVSREAFLHQYYGQELDPAWLGRVANLDKKWGAFAEKHGAKAAELRSGIAEVSDAAGLPIAEVAWLGAGLILLSSLLFVALWRRGPVAPRG